MYKKRTGSSPHTRGLRCPRRPGRRRRRIIPAHAGFTGEPLDHGGRRVGSSPHTRGLRPSELGTGAGAGIIPAHAGFTPHRRRRRGLPADHPRTRGVYIALTHDVINVAGSSPHTRGLPAACGGGEDVLGIIPAHAGFTHPWRRRGRQWRDHPRTRGVYSEMRDAGLEGYGSSPHTRGLRAAHRARVAEGGIIPAHAGFTSRRTRS